MKPIVTYQKLRGGYYTPKPIADFLARWAIQSASSTVLEPSFGDGVLIEAAVESLLACGATTKEIPLLLNGVELDEHETLKAAERLRGLGLSGSSFHLSNGDFFAYAKNCLTDKRRFDAIIGNPPFIRYQNFLEEHRVTAFYLMQLAGLHPTRLTNAWVPFLVASTLLLTEHGRLAMVIPAELLQVNYAAELRYFLSTHYSKLTLITFKKLVFDGIQQEVILLLGEQNGDERTGIRTIELADMDDLAAYDHAGFAQTALKQMDHSSEKWTMYFLEQAEIELLRRLRTHPKLTPSGHVIDVDVGIVTGLNEFFVLNQQQVAERALGDYTQPIVGRSHQLKGLVFAEQDWQGGAEKSLPAFLLYPPDVPFDLLPDAVKRYILDGEAQNFHLGYKCRIRNRWYIVPSLWTPQAFMLRQVHAYPKIIINTAGATCTDTIHRVRLRNGISVEVAASAFLNSLTFAFTEVVGRSYGGGVLELEPNEAEQLPLPLIGADQLDVQHLDALLLTGSIDKVLDITDKILLMDGLGLCQSEVRMLRGIWQKLRDRRINRK